MDEPKEEDKKEDDNVDDNIDDNVDDKKEDDVDDKKEDDVDDKKEDNDDDKKERRKTATEMTRGKLTSKLEGLNFNAMMGGPPPAILKKSASQIEDDGTKTDQLTTESRASDIPENETKEEKAKRLANAGAIGFGTTGMGMAMRDLGFAISKSRGEAGDGKINIKSIAKQAERIHARDKVTLEDLRANKLPGGIKVEFDKREEYLNDNEFQRAFGMDREAFNKLPLWRKREYKKKAGIF